MGGYSKAHRKFGSALIYPPCQSGGARRDRTADPLLAKQVLSQLSYGPETFHRVCDQVGLPVATGLPRTLMHKSGGSGWI